MLDEDKCERCGKCCKIKWWHSVFAQRAVLTGEDCGYLVRLADGTTTCAVYKDRHTSHPSCVDLQTAIADGILPETCAYVRNLKGYKCRVDYDRVVKPQKDVTLRPADPLKGLR